MSFPADVASLEIIPTRPPIDADVLTRAFASFKNAASSLEQSYFRLHREVEGLRRQLDEKNRDLAVLAHEVRNPLGSLELFAGLLAGSNLVPEQRSWVEQVQRGLRMMSAAVNNILEIHGEGALRVAIEDLGELAQAARVFLLPLARRAGVDLEVVLPPLLILVNVDRQALAQVVLNLAINALAAMPSGGWLRLRAGADTVCGFLEVSDTGPGISPEHLPELFRLGFTTRPGSAGLGLAVCQRIMRQHGGAITVTSCDQGTTFRLTFPRPRAVQS